MDLVECLNRFQLKQNKPFHYEVRYVFTTNNTIVANVITNLLSDRKTNLLQLMHHGVLVNFFQKATTQLVRDSEHASNNCLCQHFISAYISVYLRFHGDI